MDLLPLKSKSPTEKDNGKKTMEVTSVRGCGRLWEVEIEGRQE
jgi:hypothetical protein